MAEPRVEMKAIGFPTFGGLRLDLALDEVGADSSIYQHDVDWDGSLGKIRTRDGFQKLNASAASGEYRGLYPHSALRLLATKRISGTENKLVALDKEGTEKTVTALAVAEAPSTFASIGTPTGTFSYQRSFTAAAKVIKFDGTTFTEPTATIANVNKETGEKEAELTGKAMPLARHMVGWPDADNVLVFANTSGTTGGPNGAASSASHVWFSKPLAFESFEESAFLVLGAGDGEEITGLCVYGGQVYVFKESRFWVVSPPSQNEHGQPVFSFREVSLGSGSRIKQVLTEHLKETSDNICWASQDGVFFCTTDGIYQTTGGSPSKISQQLKPLEETVPFEGPMAEFLNGSSESFRWPATGIAVLGRRVFVKRYEFIFVYDIVLQSWTCWKMPSVSMAIWTGLTGGGSETTGYKNASTAAAEGVGTEWSNPGNAKVSDGVYATVFKGSPTGSTNTNFLKLTNYGFALPAGAVVAGILVNVQRKEETASGGVSDHEAHLVRAGTIQAGERAHTGVPWGVVDASAYYGGSEDLWDEAWTLTDINSAGFGVALSAHITGSNRAMVDWIGVTVYYLTAESSSGVRPRLFNSQTKTVFWTGPNAEEQATFPGWAWQSGLYDLGSEDEKELVKSKVWGEGTIAVGVSQDFKAMEERHTFAMGEATTQKAENISQKATLFSHRFSGSGKASIQRFVRYLRTTATSGSQSDPS